MEKQRNLDRLCGYLINIGIFAIVAAGRFFYKHKAVRRLMPDIHK